MIFDVAIFVLALVQAVATVRNVTRINVQPSTDHVPSVLRGEPLRAQQTDVHVLMPTKRPLRLASTVDLLLTLANRTFGDVVFHFGVDWYDNETIDAVARVLDARTSVRYSVHRVLNRVGDISTIVNHLFRVTGGTYFLRYNDDSHMLTRHWNQLAVQALRTKPVDLGIAWMTDLKNQRLQTHSFVSYKHRELFGCYFPEHFKNWSEDTWITDVYPIAWRKQSGVRLKHLAVRERYAIERVPKPDYKQIVETSKAIVRRYCVEHNITQCRWPASRI